MNNMFQPLKSNEYKCAACHGVFEKGWSDEEARAERRNIFPDAQDDDCAVVCDNCFHDMKKAGLF